MNYLIYQQHDDLRARTYVRCYNCQAGWWESNKELRHVAALSCLECGGMQAVPSKEYRGDFDEDNEGLEE